MLALQAKFAYQMHSSEVGIILEEIFATTRRSSRIQFLLRFYQYLPEAKNKTNSKSIIVLHFSISRNLFVSLT